MKRPPVLPHGHRIPWTLILVLLCSAMACAAERPYVWADSLPASHGSGEVTIRPGDHVFVLVQGQDAMSGELPVRADGSIVQPVIGRLDLAGASTGDAARRISERLRGVVVDPRVNVSIVSTTAKISVVGEVAHPGPFDIGATEGVLEAIARAGGLTEFADKDRIFVLRRHPTLSRVRFRYSDLVGAETHSISFRLQDDDVVVVE